MKQILHAILWTRRHLAGGLPAPELTPLLRCLRPDDVFLDIGAHAGSWTVPVAPSLTSGHVYAFEALPYYATVLKMTLALLGRRNVTVISAAVSDSNGEAQVVWKDPVGRRLTGKTHISHGDEKGETVRVRTLTIDGFREEHPKGRVRLVKCDVEGAELMVLRGAASTIERWRPLVFCEIYDDYCAQYGHSSRDVFGFFEARGYGTMQFDNGAFRPLDPEKYGGVGDVLFVPGDAERRMLCG